MKVNWDDEIPNIWENKTCSKPPTSLYNWYWNDFKLKNGLGKKYPHLKVPKKMGNLWETLSKKKSLGTYYDWNDSGVDHRTLDVTITIKNHWSELRIRDNLSAVGTAKHFMVNGLVEGKMSRKPCSFHLSFLQFSHSNSGKAGILLRVCAFYGAIEYINFTTIAGFNDK